MRRVLFVDDEIRILEGLRRSLLAQHDEWEMTFAPSGEAALALMEAAPFDVIVSDLRMPGMDGVKLLAQVREQYPQVVRIVLSARTELSSALRAVPVAHQFLTKPCDATTLRVAVERACHLKNLLSDEGIRSVVGALADLPSIPRIYDALTRALATSDRSIQEIARIIEQDVGISAKVLQLVNSALFGIAHSITNIPHAVIYLGINTLRSLVFSLEVFHVFEPKAPLAGFSLEGLQHHAWLTAHVTARLPVPRHLAEITMVAGMLHDVGKLILASKLPDRFKKMLAEATKERCPLYRVEEREYGFSHAEIGAYLLGLWGLPYILVEAVALHHAPTRVPHETLDAVSAVYVANLLGHELEALSSGVPFENSIKINQEELAALGIQADLSSWRARAAQIPAVLVEA